MAGLRLYAPGVGSIPWEVTSDFPRGGGTTLADLNQDRVTVINGAAELAAATGPFNDLTQDTDQVNNVNKTGNAIRFSNTNSSESDNAYDVYVVRNVSIVIDSNNTGGFGITIGSAGDGAHVIFVNVEFLIEEPDESDQPSGVGGGQTFWLTNESMNTSEQVIQFNSGESSQNRPEDISTQTMEESRGFHFFGCTIQSRCDATSGSNSQQEEEANQMRMVIGECHDTLFTNFVSSDSTNVRYIVVTKGGCIVQDCLFGGVGSYFPGNQQILLLGELINTDTRGFASIAIDNFRIKAFALEANPDTTIAGFNRGPDSGGVPRSNLGYGSLKNINPRSLIGDLGLSDSIIYINSSQGGSNSPQNDLQYRQRYLECMQFDPNWGANAAGVRLEYTAGLTIDNNTQTYTSDGSSAAFTLNEVADGIIHVQVGDDFVSVNSHVGALVTLDAIPADGAEVVITYRIHDIWGREGQAVDSPIQIAYLDENGRLSAEVGQGEEIYLPDIGGTGIPVYGTADGGLIFPVRIYAADENASRANTQTESVLALTGDSLIDIRHFWSMSEETDGVQVIEIDPGAMESYVNSARAGLSVVADVVPDGDTNLSPDVYDIALVSRNEDSLIPVLDPIFDQDVNIALRDVYTGVKFLHYTNTTNDYPTVDDNGTFFLPVDIELSDVSEITDGDYDFIDYDADNTRIVIRSANGIHIDANNIVTGLEGTGARREVDLSGQRLRGFTIGDLITISDPQRDTSAGGGVNHTFDAITFESGAQIELDLSNSAGFYSFNDCSGEVEITTTGSGGGTQTLLLRGTSVDNLTITESSDDVVTQVITDVVISGFNSDNPVVASAVNNMVAYAYNSSDDNYGSKLTNPTPVADTDAVTLTFSYLHSSDTEIRYALAYDGYEIVTDQENGILVDEPNVDFDTVVDENNILGSIDPDVLTYAADDVSYDSMNGIILNVPFVSSADTITLNIAQSKYFLRKVFEQSVGDIMDAIAQRQLDRNWILFEINDIAFINTTGDADDVAVSITHDSDSDTIWRFNIEPFDLAGSNIFDDVTSGNSNTEIRFLPEANIINPTAAELALFADQLSTILDEHNLSPASVTNLGLGVPAVDEDDVLQTTPTLS